ncbi:MAG: nucleotidyltransferase domain-containing protein [Clostridia bacterium]|nr:nucleotidyltransferase domain-containing protein [Clostridia bacterium]
MMDSILSYLREQYYPQAVIVYGSYAAGTQEAGSDFDALVITDRVDMKLHDTCTIGGVLLDVFVYSPRYLDSLDDLSEIIQIRDGIVVNDTNGYASQLRARVMKYIQSQPKLTVAEKNELCVWCKKMALRAKREDAEGLYRWHWLLTDSLSIYCELRDVEYLGPKKTLARMRLLDADGYTLYQCALTDRHALVLWVEYLCAATTN